MSKKTGFGIWVNDREETTKTDGSHPNPRENWWAAYNPRRVHGDRYEPYVEDSFWGRSANQAMSREANDNFLNRR